ncbi:MAG: glycerophosphodiester phosphodiesterase [Actinomycetota bacterium]|nr:glycerophosphodiester phosphodiesterase [Actinomycetota bacterium]
MAPRLPSIRRPPIGFAHRGARANAPENTLEAFSLALRLGASGLETDAWVTADGVVVLDHDGVVGGRFRRRPISSVDRGALPSHIPSLGDLYAECGTDYELSIDVKDPAAAAGIVDVARAAGGDALGRLWLCDGDLDLLRSWRELDDDVRLVDSTRLRRMRHGAERRASQLADAGIDAVNMMYSDWSGGLTTLFHRFKVLAFGWDAQHRRVLDELLDMGIDAVFSDHVDRMVDALRALDP